MRLTSAALAVLLGGGGLALLAQADAPLPSEHEEKAAAAAPAWIQINRPFQLYSLETPETAKLLHLYEARRHVTGGGRKDILTFGAPKSDSAYFRLVLYRRGEEEAPNVPFFVDLARSAADGDLSITKSMPPALMVTRFGDAEVSDVTLTAAEGAPLPCLGVRMQAKNLAWHLTGFACGGSKPLPRAELQCVFDRLDLNTAGEDTALAKFFADTELRRNPECSGTRMTPTLTHAAVVLEEKSPPPAVRTPKR